MSLVILRVCCGLNQQKSLFIVGADQKAFIVGITQQKFCRIVCRLSLFQKLIYFFKVSFAFCLRIRPQINNCQIDGRIIAAQFCCFVKIFYGCRIIDFGSEAVEIQAAQIVKSDGVLFFGRLFVIGKSLFIVSLNAVDAVQVHIAEVKLRFNIPGSSFLFHFFKADCLFFFGFVFASKQIKRVADCRSNFVCFGTGLLFLSEIQFFFFNRCAGNVFYPQFQLCALGTDVRRCADCQSEQNKTGIFHMIPPLF